MSMKNKQHSQATKDKISVKSKGNKSFLGRKHSEESKRKMSEAQKKTYQNGRVSSFTGIRPPNQPEHLSEETKLKISQKLMGEKNPMWKGGVTSHKQQIRHSFAYKQWRTDVFKRDGNKCVLCGIKGEMSSPYLLVDHIKSFHHHPELRTDVTNGRVLCLNCHCQTENYGGKVHKLTVN